MEPSYEPRNVLLIGHGVDNDLHTIRQMGIQMGMEQSCLGIASSPLLSQNTTKAPLEILVSPKMSEMEKLPIYAALDTVSLHSRISSTRKNQWRSELQHP
jgi:hypothetical protein